MTNHRLSIEQKFQLEAAFRDIDACDDIGKLREITKAIITAQENEKAFARDAILRMRQEIEAQTRSTLALIVQPDDQKLISAFNSPKQLS